MADFVLSLGGVGFEDFEIPDNITAGGDQTIATRKYAGGVRTIDAMGPDDKPLTWEGWFEGPAAIQRCQQIDIMRRQGSPVVCAWAAYSYQVIIKTFKWQFHRFWHIHYSIELEVIQDQNYPPQQAQPSADSQMQSDVSDASGGADDLPSTPPMADTSSNGGFNQLQSGSGPTQIPSGDGSAATSTPIPTDPVGWGVSPGVF